MLLMHGPAPAENRSFQRRSQQEWNRTTNEKRMAPLASSSPLPWEPRASSDNMQSTTVVDPWKRSPSAMKPAFRPLQVVKRTKYSVALSHWHSLSDFFVQLGMHTKVLNEIIDVLRKAFEYNYSQQRSAASKSAMCMAKWEGDENWYRGELLDSEGLVLFVDFGTVSVVRRPDAIHDLPHEALLTDTEALAVRCSLSGLRLFPGVDDVNHLSHPDGQSLADWFKCSIVACDIIFTGNVSDDTHEVVLVQRADGQLLSELIARRYPHAFELVESAISLPQSLVPSECNTDGTESPSSTDKTKPMSPNDGDQSCSPVGVEETARQGGVFWQFGVNDFVDATITHLDPIKLDMVFVLAEHLMEKLDAVTVACCQECSIAPLPHLSTFTPGTKFAFQDQRDKKWYRAVLIKPKSDEGVMYKLFLMDVGRFESFNPSQVRKMPACLMDLGPLAACVQVRRRPSQLAVNDRVIFRLATIDAIPVVDMFLDYNDYVTAEKENAEHSNLRSRLPPISDSSHQIQTQEHDNEPLVDSVVQKRENSTNEFLDREKLNQPKEATVIAKVAHMEGMEGENEEAIIRPVQSTILAKFLKLKEGERSTTADNCDDESSDGGGANGKTPSPRSFPTILPSNSSPLKATDTAATTVNETTNLTKLRVPQLTLSNGDSLLVHLEIDSLIDDPHNFVLTKDCGSEFPLLLDEMNSREKTPMTEVNVGDHCVLVDGSGRMAQYHRVEVAETNEAKRVAKVRRLDHGGTFDDVRFDELFQLVADDVRLARVAIPSRLSPEYYKFADWDTSEVRHCLRKYALITSFRQHLLLRAHIVAFNGDVATVQLYTRNDSSDVITEALCSVRQKRISAERAAANASAKNVAPTFS